MAMPNSACPTATPSRFTSSPSTSLDLSTAIVNLASDGSSAAARDSARFSTSALPAAFARAAASFHATHALALCPVCS